MKISKINVQLSNNQNIKNTNKKVNSPSFGYYHFLNGDENKYSNWLVEEVDLVKSLKDNEFINFVGYRVGIFLKRYKQNHPILWAFNKKAINEESGQRFEDYVNVRKYLQKYDKSEHEYEGEVDSLRDDYSSQLALEKRYPPSPPHAESENTFHYDHV